MAKFERLDRSTRQQEIKAAAMKIFLEKGFSATTMENIVQQVSLSKGGVYRIYPSTKAILSDLLIDGMHQRNDFYRQKAQEFLSCKEPVSMENIADIICQSLLLLPETASLYAELLMEKRRDRELESLYQELCKITVTETIELIRQFGMVIPSQQLEPMLEQLTNLMNTAILGIAVLGLREDFVHHRKQICNLLANLMYADVPRSQLQETGGTQ